MSNDEMDPVAVFVRLCGDRRPEECRELGFRIPNGISQMELLEAGYAVDGHSAIISVTDYEDDGQYVPLSDALRDAQLSLVKLLADRGHQVVFK